MNDVALCGWRVASEIALPELPAWDGDGTVDVHIVVGAVPAALARSVLTTPYVQVSMAGGQVLLHVAGVGGYLVEDGRRVTVAPVVPRDAPDLRLYLLGAVLGYLCHQRGLLPVHAAAVEIDGRAVLFAGQSGAGKSTLAAAFWQRGYRLLSDDLAPIDPAGETALVLPSLRRIRLWPDSAAELRWPGGLERCRADLPKVSRGIVHGLAGALPAAAIFHLGSRAGTTPDTPPVRLRGAAAIDALGRKVYRSRAYMAMLGETEGLRGIAAVAARIPRHYRFDRVRDFAALDDQIDRVLATVRGG